MDSNYKLGQFTIGWWSTKDLFTGKDGGNVLKAYSFLIIESDKKLFPHPGFKFKQILQNFLNRLDQHEKNNQKSNKGNQR